MVEYEMVFPQLENLSTNSQRIFDLIIGQDSEWISQEVDRRIAAMSEKEKQSIPENELRHKVYYEVWDGSGIEGWYD